RQGQGACPVCDRRGLSKAGTEKQKRRPQGRPSSYRPVPNRVAVQPSAETDLAELLRVDAQLTQVACFRGNAALDGTGCGNRASHHAEQGTEPVERLVTVHFFILCCIALSCCAMQHTYR